LKLVLALALRQGLAVKNGGSDMEDKVRHEVIMTGVGGMGIQLAGMLLAQAARPAYKYVSWCPLYTTAMRMGACECTVILSDERIASPLKSYVGEMMVLEASQMEPFIGRVLPGGLVIAESAGLAGGIPRDDVTGFIVPAVETALSLGNRQVSNLVLLGAYVGLSKAITPELMEQELERRFAHRAAMLALNKRAFEKGLELAGS